eukprot:183265-Pyramimonas_sp.AAC.1
MPCGGAVRPDRRAAPPGAEPVALGGLQGLRGPDPAAALPRGARAPDGQGGLHRPPLGRHQRAQRGVHDTRAGRRCRSAHDERHHRQQPGAAGDAEGASSRSTAKMNTT